MSTSQVVQVQVTVTNEQGEVAYDIYEFYINDAPNVGEIAISAHDESGNGTAIDSLYHIQLTNWYDSTDDTELQIWNKIYL